MPRFLTISPSHVQGKKEYAWRNFQGGRYIAIGWMHEDLSGKSLREVYEIIRLCEHPSKKAAPSAFRKFLALSVGDYVAVTNAGQGLFGIGRIDSDYVFNDRFHDAGDENRDNWYSHLRKVDWGVTSYRQRTSLLLPGEKGWPLFGTVGPLLDQVPEYITRALQGHGATIVAPQEKSVDTPLWLVSILEAIKTLHEDPHHLERAHESLVEQFLTALGYAPHKEVKFGKGFIDVAVEADGKILILFEVKKDWDLGSGSDDAIEQALVYASWKGVRYFAITNGDYYRLYDRTRGLSLDSHFSGEFRLSKLRDSDLTTIESLRPEKLKGSPDS